MNHIEVFTDGELSNVKGFISYPRLHKFLVENGEIGLDEKVTHFEVTDRGIQYGVEQKKALNESNKGGV